MNLALLLATGESLFTDGGFAGHWSPGGSVESLLYAEYVLGTLSFPFNPHTTLN